METALSALAVFVARPGVQVDGQERAIVNDLLIGMRYEESERAIGAMELRFSNIASEADGAADLAFEDETVLRLGSEIVVNAGDVNAPTELFTGVVTGIEADFPEDGPPELVVHAEDALQRGRMARRTRLHEDVSVADIANTVAQQLNLTPVVTQFGDPIGMQMQLNESDYAFLRRLLLRFDGDVQVVGNELHVTPRSETMRNAIELELFSQLRRVQIMADLTHQSTQVTVTGWNATQGNRVSATSTGAHQGPGRGRTGADELAATIGDRTEHVGCPAVATQAEATAMADAIFDSCARRFVCVQGTAEGNPELRIGTHVTLSGVSSRFDNTYYVSRACHRFDVDNGYQTDFEAESAFLGGP